VVVNLIGIGVSGSLLFSELEMGCVLAVGGFICPPFLGCLMKGSRNDRNIKGKISYFPVFVFISFDDDDDDDNDNNNKR
jgi:hypothetical protein